MLHVIRCIVVSYNVLYLSWLHLHCKFPCVVSYVVFLQDCTIVRKCVLRVHVGWRALAHSSSAVDSHQSECDAAGAPQRSAPRVDPVSGIRAEQRKQPWLPTQLDRLFERHAARKISSDVGKCVMSLFVSLG